MTVKHIVLINETNATYPVPDYAWDVFGKFETKGKALEEIKKFLKEHEDDWAINPIDEFYRVNISHNSAIFKLGVWIED